MTIPRHEYRLELDAMPQAPLPLAAAAVRIPSTEDADALAELMLDAYRGTIDYDDETLEDARSEVARHLAGSPMLECSSVWVADDDRLASALLVSLWPSRSCPIVSYVHDRSRPEEARSGVTPARPVAGNARREWSPGGTSRHHRRERPLGSALRSCRLPACVALFRAEGPPARAFGWCDLRNGGNAALIQAQLPERGLRAF